MLATRKHPASAGAFVYGRTRQVRKASSPHAASHKRLPLHAWNIRVHATYPASMRWETCEQIPAMLQDHDAEYDRHNTRGIPRPGAARWHGIVYWGACGHTMLVPYTHSTRYVCHHLRQHYGVRVCQYIPADPIDARVVEAFFQALAPIALDVSAPALAAHAQTHTQRDHAHQQALERLR